MKTDFDVPGKIAVCPHCGGKLYLEVDEWLEDGTPTKSGCHVSCENEPDDDPNDVHFQMPYVYWLPLTMRVYYWAEEHIRICPDEAEVHAKLAAWTAQRPIAPGEVSLWRIDVLS